MKNLSNFYTLLDYLNGSKLEIIPRYLVQINYTIDLYFKGKNFTINVPFCVRKDQIIDFINDSKKSSEDHLEAILQDNDSESFIKLRKKDSLGHFEFEIYLVDVEIKGTSVVKDNIVTDEISVVNFLKYLKILLYEVDDIAYERNYEQKFLKRQLKIPEL